ncbi:MAG: discoidin domain-containing protein [Opitutaceae bacterium]|nr:discoidin domain-containing protein [Opitutaceae bacterium]
MGELASTLADLNLRLRNSNASFALGIVVAESTSALDNVEHIYRAALPAGYYALEVSGPAGTPYGLAWNGRSSVPPIVTAPAITTQPTAAAVTEGQSAKFSVTATGGNLTYQWTKDGSSLSGATAASYSIAATTTASAGTYSVTVRNSAGSVTSSSVALTVAAKVAVPGELTPVAYSARGQNGTTEGIAKLFDGATSTKWLDFSGSTWVQVSFASAQSISTYSLTSANDNPVRDPAAWTLSGSNDGTTWTVLERRSAEVFASRFLRRDFALAQPSTAYLHYRLDLTAKSGSITQLAELKFTAAVEAAPTPPTAPVTTVELLPSGISARGENGTKEGVANLLDHSTSTKWLDFSGTTWVQVSFATPRALEAYSLTSANDNPVRDPAAWTLSGSTDGVAWTALESRNGEVFASRYLERDFVLTATSAAYLHYRLEMTAKSGTITQLSGLEFWGSRHGVGTSAPTKWPLGQDGRGLPPRP